MDALTFPLSNCLMVLTAPHAASALMLELSARLSAAGELRVLDGGNRFNVYPVARAVRRYTSDLTGALARIRLSRAFTCYQMAALLAENPADGLPVLVIDLLATFYDDNAKLIESQRLLADCIPHLKRLSQFAPVVVSAKPPTPLCAEKGVLADALQAAASSSWHLEALPAPRMPTLWGEEA
jgi:hypothetical protein